jgi:Family of unknown function (DUF5629)
MSLTLAQALESADMLVIDELYCFDFSLAADGLRVLCMDGRTERRWHFDLQAIAAASFDSEQDCWNIAAAGVAHRLRLLSAFSADEDDDQE